MSNSDADEFLVRSAFRDLEAAVPSPPSNRLATVEATVRRRRRRRVGGLVVASAVATALAVTPAVLARGGGSADTPAVPPSQGAPPSEPTRQFALGTCQAKGSRQGVDLSVTATDIVLGPQREEPQARRRGDMAVTVCSAGEAAAPAGTLTLRWLATITPDTPMGTGSWAGCRLGEPVTSADGLTYSVVHCDSPELPPGSSWEPMFLFEMPASADPGIGRTLAQYVEVSASGDVNTRDNLAAFKVREVEQPGSVGQPPGRSCASKTPRQGVDLAVVATALTLGPAPTGNEPRRGDMIITVCNNGRAAAPAGTLTLRWLSTIPPDAEMGSESWAGCRYGEPERAGAVTYTVVHCDFEELATGKGREQMFLFEIPGGADPGIDRQVSQYAQVSTRGDTNTRNNRATFKIATV